MNGDDNFVLHESEGVSDRLVKDLRYRLDLEIVIAGAKRPHFPALAFLGAVRDTIGPGTSHPSLFLDPFKIARLSPAARDRPMGAL
ncbi:hypothetical protein GALL_490690 [mine drainage metagenome]|uniref:Uncharacterized protein n=1 Tax=mine drainage metagenome TaxID=410659 RepID=A0A1J5PDC4_9ZZZZ